MICGRASKRSEGSSLPALIAAAAAQSWNEVEQEAKRRLEAAQQPTGAASGTDPQATLTSPRGTSPRGPSQPEEELRTLSQLDEERLVGALERQDIRLLRVEWLLAQPDDYKIERRQDLEKLETRLGGASLSPLLTGAEAVALIRNGRREVGALSYGWLLPWDPDPTRERTALLRRALVHQRGIKALFIDQCTLYQPPRTKVEDAAFGRALDVMMDLYASPVGTTVLQLKEIPRRPVEFDGLLCLGKLTAGVGEAEIRAALQSFGKITICQVGVHPGARVTFATREAAEQASKAKLSVCGFAFLAWNDRPYNDIDQDGEGRGWCVCEESLSMELIARLQTYPKMKSVLETLPPKVLGLSSTAPPKPIVTKAADVHTADHVSTVLARFAKATFTNPDDAHVVPNLYKDFVRRITSVLTQTLAFAAKEGQGRAALPHKPEVELGDFPLCTGDFPRSYMPEQLLTLWLAEVGCVQVAVVEAQEGGFARLKTAEGDEFSLALQPWNHAPTELPLQSLAIMLEWHAAALRLQHSHITDALSGRKLEVLEQLVPIGVSGGSKGKLGRSIQDVGGLARWLLSMHAECGRSGTSKRPACVLLTGGPAAGKTCLMSQLVVRLLHNQPRSPVVPILVKVQLLQRRLLADEEGFANAWNFVDAFLCAEHGAASAVYRALRSTMVARHAVLLLDGIDEGGVARERIERHLVEVLAPQGHVILCTSRPTGLDEDRFKSFRRLQLLPLSESQQKRVIQGRVGEERAATLLPFVKGMPVEKDEARYSMKRGVRVTANPLMLSMVISIFEVRQTDMPSTKEELFAVATKAMCERCGLQPSGTVYQLLQATFLEAHASQSRVIEVAQLEAAALRLADPAKLRRLRGKPAEVRTAVEALPEMVGAIREVRERLEQDRLPMLSLLQAEPLQLQSTHLSFQEWFTAKALCEGRVLPAAAWEGRAWWANMLEFAKEMDASGYRLGLSKVASTSDRSFDPGDLGSTPDEMIPLVMLIAADGQFEGLKLQGKNIGRVGCEAIGEALKVNETLTTVDLDGFELPITKLKGTEPVTSLNFREKHLTAASAIVVAKCLEVNAGLTYLGLYSNEIGDAGATAIAETLKVNTVLTKLELWSNKIGHAGATAIAEALKVNAVLTVLNLQSNRIGDAGAKAIAEALLVTAVLKDLNLKRNNIGPVGARALAGALRVNAVLTVLNLNENKIGPVGIKALGEALAVNAVLTKFTLWDSKIGDVGAKAIAEALRVNAGLTVLVLVDNNIGDEGAKALAEALKVNAGLTQLSLGGNKIGDAGATAIAEALKVNAVLTVLELPCNNIGMNIGQEAQKALREAARPELKLYL